MTVGDIGNSVSVAKTAAPAGRIGAPDIAKDVALKALGEKNTPERVNFCLANQEHFDKANDSLGASRQKENVSECLDPQMQQLAEQQKHYHKQSPLGAISSQLGQFWDKLVGKATDGFPAPGQ